jgi:hypothetical protein
MAQRKKAFKTKLALYKSDYKARMALDRNNQYAKIRLMLAQEYVNIFKCTENEIGLFLKDWLTSVQERTENKRDYFEEIKNLRNTSILTTYKLSGAAGRRQAVQFYLKYAQYMSPGVELWSYTTENPKWFNESSEFLSEWFMRVMTFLSEDNKIKIIHPLNSSYESLAISMLTWSPMHMTGRTTAYFIPRNKDEQLVHTYFLVKDHLALYNWSTKLSAREMNTYITHEPQFVKDIELNLQCFFDESTRIFEHFIYDTKDAYINSVVATLEKTNNEYHWSLSFPVCYMSDKMLYEILTENGLSGDELEQSFEKLSLISELSGKSPHCHFIDLERLRKQLQHETIAFNELSFICGRDIRLDRSAFMRLIGEALDIVMNSDKIKLCLASTDLLVHLGEMEVVAKENMQINFSCTRSEPPRILVTKELNVVASLYQYFEALWNTTPYIYKNKEYVLKQVKKIVAEVTQAEDQSD